MITLFDPIPRELAQNLPSRIFEYIHSVSGDETTIPAVARRILEFADGVDPDLRIVPPTKGDPLMDAVTFGQFVLTMGHPDSRMAWCLAKYRQIGLLLILPGSQR